MKKSVLKKCVLHALLIVAFCMTTLDAGIIKASADYTMCPSCVGMGYQNSTTFENVLIGFDTFTGPRYAMVPKTISLPCSACGGTGRQWIPSSSTSSSSSESSSTPSTSSSESSSTSNNSSSATKKVKNGVVLAATDGIGNYEDAPNLLDGDKKTKFNVKATRAYIIWKAPKLISVSSYNITIANDTATYKCRNPKAWVLYGSNKKLSRNAKGWKVVHSVKNDKKLKAINFKTFNFRLKKAAKPYLYYKLEIKDNQGGDCTQLADFVLKGKTVTVKKTAVKNAKKTGNDLKLKWKKVSGATGYEIEYSTSAKFKNVKKVKVKGAGKISKTIKGVKAGKKNYVRIRSYKTVNGAIVRSGWVKKTIS